MQHGKETSQGELENLDHRCNHSDEDDEPQIRKIHLRQPGPVERSRRKQVTVDEIVYRNRNRLDDDNGNTEPDRGRYPFGDCDIGAHPQQERERKILDEHRSQDDVEDVRRHANP